MGRIAHFDILVKDIERASKFYTAAFGWTIEPWDGPMEYWFIITGDGSAPGINGGMAVGEPNFTEGSLTMEIDDLSEVMGLVTAHGGKLVDDPHPIVGVGFFATVEDTEGNRFGLMQNDETAGR